MLRGGTSCAGAVVPGQRSSTSTDDPCHVAGSSPAGAALPSLETLSRSFASSRSSPYFFSGSSSASSSSGKSAGVTHGAMQSATSVSRPPIPSTSQIRNSVWDDDATLDDLNEAVTTLEDTARIARRVLGGAHPDVVGIEKSLRNARALMSLSASTE